MQMTGNIILLTGATSGIGRALAERFHHHGNQVIIAGRRRHLLDEVTCANPGMQGLAVDVDDSEALDAFAGEVRERFPRLNVLVNNAGISRPEDLTADAVDVTVGRSIVQTNVLSVLHLTAALLPTLRRQPAATVVATTSGLAFTPFARFPAYCASKAFLHSWLQSLRFQLRDTSVEVLELIPPYVQTELGGPAQASDPHAVPLADYVREVMAVLEAGTLPGGEILVERARALRFAERSGDYDAVFWANNNRG